MCNVWCKLIYFLDGKEDFCKWIVNNVMIDFSWKYIGDDFRWCLIWVDENFMLFVILFIFIYLDCIMEISEDFFFLGYYIEWV